MGPLMSYNPLRIMGCPQGTRKGIVLSQWRLNDQIISCCPFVRSHFQTSVTILWLLMPPTYWCAKSFATNDHGIVYLDLSEVVPGFVDNFPRWSCAPAETKTLLRRPRQPLYAKKHRVSRPRVFSNLNSRVPDLLHFPTTWYTGSTQVRHL